MQKLFIYPAILIGILLLFSQSCKHKCAPEMKPVPQPVEKCTPFAATWAQITPGTETFNLRDATILDANNAVFVGSYYTSVKTNNGGKSFTSISTGNYSQSFWGCYFFDSNNGFGVGGDFTNNSQGVKVIKKTIDGGVSWNNIAIPFSDGELFCIRFFNKNIGFAVGSGGVLLKTIDEGNTWFNINTSLSSNLVYIFIVNNTIYVIGGKGGILKSPDAGQTWNVLNIKPENSQINLYDSYFFDEKTGFVVGQSGLILKTIDGGISWNTIKSAVIGKEDIAKIIFLDKCNGYLIKYFPNVSSSHFIEKTTDGGQTWTRDPINPSTPVVSMITNGLTSYALGDNGLILKLQIQ